MSSDTSSSNLICFDFTTKRWFITSEKFNLILVMQRMTSYLKSCMIHIA